jgi:hypothetical protein
MARKYRLRVGGGLLSERSPFGKPTRVIPWPWRLPGLMRLGDAMRKLYKEQNLDDPAPKLVPLDPRSSEILNLARALAGDRREDDRAVKELTDLAASDEKSLRRAGLGARQGGEHLESSWANLTHRLLEAAINKTPVSRLSEAEMARLKVLDDFAALSPADRWRALTEHESGLSGLETDARAGRFGRTMKPDDRSPQEKRQAAISRMRGREDLETLLSPLVGPQSATDDPLMSSKLALNTTRRYLLDIHD